MNKYFESSKGTWCIEHRLFFKDTCPSCGAYGTHGTISKSEVQKQFTSKSQVTTSKSQGVSKRFHKQKVSKTIFERFHNYGIKFEADVLWDALFSEAEVRLNNNVCYKRLDFPEAIVKVFKKSILVSLRSSMELKGLPVREAEAKSRSLVFGVVSQLPKAVVVKSLDVVNTHNAFVNHPVAKHELRVVVNNQARLISDHSKGYLELEAVNPEMAVSDSVLIEDDLKGLIANGLSRDFLASAIHSLIKDREYYAENLKSHVAAINKLSENVDKFSAQVDARFERSSSLLSPFSSLPENVGRVSFASTPNVSEVSSLPIQSSLVRWF